MEGSTESQAVLEQLRFRHQLIKQRTQICNRLQSLAHSAGLPKRSMQTTRSRKSLNEARLTETQTFQRDQLFELLDDITERIKVIEGWKKKLLLIDRFSFC
jgi:transposase